MAEQTFRLMDPESRRMMGLRADMTPQVARIATTRLAGSPRPLRLSYAGQCLRVHGSQLAPDRQVAQAGIELIGPDNPAADAEMVLLAAEALAAVGLTRVSFDLTVPPLAPALLDEAGITGPARDQADPRARPQGRRRGRANSAAASPGCWRTCCWPPARSARRCSVLAAGPRSARPRSRCTSGWPPWSPRSSAQSPGLRLTLDPLEFRGFRYHTGICVTVFAPGHHEELGRGGRYVSGEQRAGDRADPVSRRRAARPPEAGAARRASTCPGARRSRPAPAFAPQGFATVAALDPAADGAAEARRLGCTHILQRRRRRRAALRGGVRWPMSP